MANLERAIDQIRKLRALATSSNEHEAASAAAKATEMLQKYNLSLADIPADDPFVKSEPIDSEVLHIRKASKGSSVRWKRQLIASLAYGNFCKPIQSTGDLDTYMWIIGKPHNREVVFFLYNVLSEKFEKWSKDYSGRSAMPGTWSPRKSFLHGAVIAINQRMNEQKARFAADTSGGRALVLLDATDKALDLWVKDRFGKTRKGGLEDHDRPDYGGYVAGYEAGKGVQLQAGVGGGRAPERKAIR